jgi:hypothetical protein
MIQGRTRHLLPLLALFIAAPAARAVIAAKTPPSAIYSASAAVVTGKVTKISPESGTIEAAATTLSGQPVGDSLKIMLIDLPTALETLKPDSPLVLFVGKRSGSNALHLADTWLFPEPVPGSKGNFVVKKDLAANLRQSYPGSTAALVKVVEELKANGGKYSMLNEVSPKVFHGDRRDLGRVDLQFMGKLSPFAVPLPSSRRNKLLISLGGGFTTTEVTPSGIADPTRASVMLFPKFPPGDLIAVSLVDATGKNDLALLALTPAGELILADWGKGDAAAAPRIKKLWTDNTVASAAALGNFGEDPDRIYALVVKDDNVYRYPLDGSSPPADFVRLTGEAVSNYHKDNPRWLAGATAHPLDCNGDGRTDVLINTPAGPMLLINRGFGAFFINADLGKTLVDPAGKPLLTDKTRWTCADVDADGHDDLLVIAADGKVTAVLNPKDEAKK